MDDKDLQVKHRKAHYQSQEKGDETVYDCITKTATNGRRAVQQKVEKPSVS